MERRGESGGKWGGGTVTGRIRAQAKEGGKGALYRWHAKRRKDGDEKEAKAAMVLYIDNMRRGGRMMTGRRQRRSLCYAQMNGREAAEGHGRRVSDS
jgi:hypothetical protein